MNITMQKYTVELHYSPVLVTVYGEDSEEARLKVQEMVDGDEIRGVYDVEQIITVGEVWDNEEILEEIDLDDFDYMFEES